jgi:hypothetical protein
MSGRKPDSLALLGMTKGTTLVADDVALEKRKPAAGICREGTFQLQVSNSMTLTQEASWP